MTSTHDRPTARKPRFLRRHLGKIVALVALVAAIVAGVVLVRRARTPAAPRYLTGTITRGDVTETIRATGTVQPVLQVQVGAQVSGRITRVAVDFNTRVRQGDLLAEIDATPYRAQIAQVRASLLSARAQRVQRRADLTLAERNLARANELRARELNAQSDVDAAVAARDAARAAVGVTDAQVAQAEASLSAAEANLAYTRILAPIDGVVATRSVDPGQTVAASLQTPTLFVINNDQTHMRVIANVDEANVGKLREGTAATARVDAFPRDAFRGTVQTVRITPTTTNGVVTYQTVIDVDNPQERLRPGMTATVSVVTARREGVLRVPNAALRYRPSGAAAPDAGMASRRQGGARTGGARSPDEPRPIDRGSVYVLRDGRPVRVGVSVGLTDGTMTEVTASELADGQTVVVDESDASAAPRPAAGASRPRMF